ncbi:MAG: hypothetical protein DRI57_07190 [Deltaproteobacteria bacterium]|nr:MAG: hypothetical protein DRI57_07190 [Deltaproteobacteria bacterium]
MISIVATIANLSHLQSEILLRICNVNKIGNELIIEYKTINKGSSAIWMCQILSVRSSLECEIEVDGKDKFVKIRRAGFRVPKGVDLDQPIVGKYVKIGKGETYHSRLRLDLPLKEINPFYPYGRFADHTKTCMADRLIFEVGIIREELKGNIYKDSSGNSFALVNCTRIEKHPELIISETIKNVRLPCLKLKTENRETILKELLMDRKHRRH